MCIRDRWSNLRKWQIWKVKLIDARLYFVSIFVGLHTGLVAVPYQYLLWYFFDVRKTVFTAHYPWYWHVDVYKRQGVSPVPFRFAVTLGASMCFASPFSTPPNALVMPAGQYTFMDYVDVYKRQGCTIHPG